MLLEILSYIYFLSPAGLGNMAPVFAHKLFPKFNHPADFNLKLGGKRIFGAHKTLRGLLAGTIIGILVAYLQKMLYSTAFFSSISIIDYSSVNILLLGFLMGFGAIAGDMIESFFKRRLNIKPGQKFIPFDQTDWILGMIIFTSFVYVYTLSTVVFLIITAFVLHILFRFLGYHLKISKELW
ncbi:CDP-archaeol synthase [Candidatus Woesearchaeota archaeon]|nr:CDP-archaeol synthase [Candidatus Woesearchaeota archaeon]